MSQHKHHIRMLIDTATHAAHTVLGVTHNHHEVASAHHLVHHDHAQDLVSKGHAEWVGIGSATAPAHETHETMHHRHVEEHADMLSEHASEHRELKERHEAEHKAAIAALATSAVIGSL